MDRHGRGVRSTRAFLFLLAVVASLALPGVALAHASLVSSDPPAGATIATAGVMRLVYDEELRSDRSSVIVVGPNGEVARGGLQPSNDKTMIVDLTGVPAGSYTANWTAVTADDNGITRGKVAFSIAAASGSASSSSSPSSSPSASAAPSTTPAASASASASAAATPAPSADTTPTSSGGDVVIPIIVALAVVGVIAAGLARRSMTQRPR
ncbi:MAG: copper resistance protein CopC [Chloroflexota bacterium]